MEAMIEPLLELEAYKQLKNDILKCKTPLLASGVLESQKCHMIYALQEHLNRPSIIITNNDLRLKEIYEDMQYFTKNNAMIYPAKDIIFYTADVHSIDIVKQRIAVIDAIISGKAPTIILSIEALFDRLVKKETFLNFILTLNVADIIDMNKLIGKLVHMGYEHTELVEGAGQFAIRGGILDIFGITDENATRIEFWDNEIDSIRIIDVFSQRSIEKINSIRIIPTKELVYEDEQADLALKKIESEYLKTLEKFKNAGMKQEQERLKDIIGEIIEKLNEQYGFKGEERYIKYFYDDTVALFDYLPSDTMIFWDEPTRIMSKAQSVMKEYEESIKNHIEKGYMLPKQAEMIFNYNDIIHISQSYTQIALMTITQSIKDFIIKDVINFEVRSASTFEQRLDLLKDDLKCWKQKSYKVLILSGTKVKGEMLQREFFDAGIDTVFIQKLERPVERGEVVITTGSIQKGFEYQHINFVVVSDKELFGGEKKKRSSKKKKKGSKIESFTDLKIGDYVVHDNYGIGLYRGIEKMVVDGINKDYLKITYADGGNLYVPINQMDIIQKYIGAESKAPKLNKLGGQEWNKAKTKVKSAVQNLAKELVALYSKRQASKGFSYSCDTQWQREFEDMFPYEETDDQLVAIEDVKRDMESNRVMDRLICGDVGYGKTEIAIRAAFKAVQDGKQVAYLIPTTILAQQHYNTFAQRMKDFPIKIGLLSRFKTPKQQKETISGLSWGNVDILIGTHRILSKDIVFKDLGLVIVDEEQRFGVTHKEKLKKLKENVDVITLTATPIPRTLHMSLTGIRDMSVLEEPPEERQPVQTYVMRYDTEFIRDAILREVGRGGQVFYLHNRVRNITEVAGKLQTLIPEANIAFAHGQMSERELESIMFEYINGEIDVLVCTTIIETGLDISNANTIIIEDADRMGLSQLYQLRGRVGRSNRIAYAYLMYQKDKVLQEVAEKRLQAIKEFTEFGSGFKIAMRDLEIRGAGNLLGSEQHGHMETVGYDMYCKILDMTVKELSGIEIKEEFETSIDLNVNAYIPAKYIGNEEQKLEIYKKISIIKTEQDYFEVQEEIEDRYGDIVNSVQNLLDIALTKAEAHEMEIISIVQKVNNVIITYKNDAKPNPDTIQKAIKNYKGTLFFTSAITSYLTLKLENMAQNEIVRKIKLLLQELKG